MLPKPKRLIGVTLAVLLASTAAVLAQPRRTPDRAFQIRLGSFFPSGSSELWKLNESAFTLDTSDFDGFVFGLGYVQGVNNSLDVGLNVDFYSEDVRSAQRGFTDSAGRSVLHDTKLKMTPVTVDARWNIGGRYRQRPGGRSLLKPVFYLGGGVGVNFWEYREVGDFVFEDTPGSFIIAYDRFKETGTAFQFHGMAGVEWPLSRGFNLFVEGRYSVADADLGFDDAYNGPAELDLSGVAVYLGGSIRF